MVKKVNKEELDKVGGGAVVNTKDNETKQKFTLEYVSGDEGDAPLNLVREYHHNKDKV